MTPGKAIALDFGDYTVAIAVSPLPLPGSAFADRPGTVLVLQCGQAPDHGPSGGLAPTRDLPGTAVTAPAQRGENDQAETAGEPAAGCPVCGAPADFPPPPPSQAGSRTKRQAQEAERTARVIAWMAANCHRQDVTAAEIAAVAGLGPRRLQSVCKRDFGRSPLHLMADIRLHRVHLALTGRAPAPASIAEAARQAGHSRVTRFRAAYRARYGRNPALPGRAAAARPSDGTATVILLKR